MTDKISTTTPATVQLGPDGLPVFPPEMGVSAGYIANAMTGAALYANRIFATQTPVGLRLTFCEQAAPEATPIYRTAVFIDYSQAIALRDLLALQLKGLTVQQVTQDG